MKYINLLFAMSVLLLAASCEDDETVPMSELTVTVTLPQEMGDDVNPEGLAVTLSNTTNGNETTGAVDDTGIYTATVEEGVYNILVSGEKNYISEIGDDQFEQTVTLTGLTENISVSGTAFETEIGLFIAPASEGWVFKELYVTGSQTPEGRSYYKDKYFEIYNNSDEVLYADGISIGESDHNSSSELNIWADMIDEYFVTQLVYTIPGDGSTYPVLPGESIVLADVAIDHTADNANSVDLSGADFEWYDDHILDVDVPEVPNLVKNFSYSKSIWTPHNKGFKSYVIFRPEDSMDDFLESNLIEKQNANGSTSIRYRIPNSSILDAVEMGTPSDFLSKGLSPALDLSYINCGDGDDARYGKVVRRKVQSVQDGRIIYMDTNNSAVDFLSTVDPKPGIIEE